VKRHPVNPHDLALYAGGDVNLLDRIRIALHLQRCPACASEVESLRDVAVILKQDASFVPEGIDWERLSAEMTANIHLGLDAGAIVGADSEEAARAPRQEAMGWRLGIVMASLALIVVSGWWLGRSHPAAPVASAAPVTIIQAGSEGVELQDHGSALAMYSQGQANTSSSVDVSGAAQAQYVNASTGQATIYRVYAE
jgi:anti-sigma factor RsiW